jgi:hypothetical protein
VDLPWDGNSPSASHQITLQVRLKLELNYFFVDIS